MPIVQPPECGIHQINRCRPCCRCIALPCAYGCAACHVLEWHHVTNAGASRVRQTRQLRSGLDPRKGPAKNTLQGAQSRSGRDVPGMRRAGLAAIPIRAHSRRFKPGADLCNQACAYRRSGCEFRRPGDNLRYRRPVPHDDR